MRALRSAPILLVLLQCVSSLPVTHTHLEQEDVKAIRCIVEVLSDALSKPHSLPVSQRCLETLRTDDRLATMLRRHNFLQELQDIAAEGVNERSEKGDETRSDQAPDLQEAADQSMLMPVLTPGKTLRERGAKEKKLESQENDIITGHEKEEKKKHALMKNVENSDEEEDDETGAAGALEQIGVEEASQEESQEAMAKQRASMKRQKDWSQSKETVHRTAYGQQGVRLKSKEMWKSPEEEELQVMAGRETEARRDPEEGSATKKTEDAEMESLAVMENELESMAQKLHKLRHG